MAAWSWTLRASWPTYETPSVALRPIARSRPASRQNAVARDRRARDHERHRRRDERKPRLRRHIVERVLPRERAARHQHHVVAERDHAGGADAERRIADLERVRRDRERRSPAALVRAIGPQADKGRTRERLDRDIAERKAIAGFAEDLAGAAAVVRRQAVEETREARQCGWCRSSAKQLAPPARRLSAPKLQPP